MKKVKFLPSNTEIECGNESIFELAEKSNVAIENSCGASGTCGLCRVKIVEGVEHLNPITRTEISHLGTLCWLTHIRLACCCNVVKDGNVVVEVKE